MIALQSVQLFGSNSVIWKLLVSFHSFGKLTPLSQVVMVVDAEAEEEVEVRMTVKFLYPCLPAIFFP